MRNKKGFVFVETLVVVAVLTASLLMLYSTYSAIVRKEKTRITYNDPVYLYRTYYLEKFFEKFDFYTISSFLNRNDPIKPVLLTSFGCTDNIFYEDTESKAVCEALIEELHITRLYFTYNDLSVLQECTKPIGVCETLDSVGNSNAAAYLKTIGGRGEKGYRIIVEYTETKDGKKCEGDNCKFYYATISLGELL